MGIVYNSTASDKFADKPAKKPSFQSFMRGLQDHREETQQDNVEDWPICPVTGE